MTEVKSSNSKLSGILKIVFINLGVLIAIILFLNFVLIVFFQAYLKIFKTTNRVAVEATLPNYKKIEWAKQYFFESGQLTTEYRSYVGWRRLPFHGKTINIDRRGIRYTPQIFENSKAPLIAFLGGSTTWGTGSDDYNTIPAIVSKIAKGKYKTINLGETSYNAFQGFLFYQLQLVEGLHPNIIVSYDGVNNYYDPDHRPNSHLREKQIQDRMRGADTAEPLSFEYLLSPLVRFVQLIRSKINDRPDKGIVVLSNTIGQEELKQTAKELLDSWLATKHLAEQNKAIFVAILQPNTAVGSPRLDHLSILYDVKTMYAYYPFVLKLLKEPKYQELSDNVLDLTHAFDGNEYIYIDYCHVSPNGNLIIAKKIYEFILLKTKKWNL